MNEKAIEVFDWNRILISSGLPVSYIGEVAIRTTIMFLFLIVALKFLSKRGVKQLSVFELAILIALGSATGDPMFYDHVPIAYGIVVLAVVILLYRIITRFAGKSKTMETLLEGEPIRLVNDGKIEFIHYKKVGLAYDKFFAELRLKSIDHLGQVKRAYLETSGEISVYYFADENVKPGLPILPEQVDSPIKKVIVDEEYACIHCGNIQKIEAENSKCEVCANDKWLLPSTNTRVK